MDTVQTSEERIVGHYISALAFPPLASMIFAVALIVCAGIQSVYLAKAVIETLNKTDDDEYEYDED